jgi:hypothetical protein
VGMGAADMAGRGTEGQGRRGARPGVPSVKAPQLPPLPHAHASAPLPRVGPLLPQLHPSCTSHQPPPRRPGSGHPPSAPRRARPPPPAARHTAAAAGSPPGPTTYATVRGASAGARRGWEEGVRGEVGDMAVARTPRPVGACMFGPEPWPPCCPPSTYHSSTAVARALPAARSMLAQTRAGARQAGPWAGHVPLDARETHPRIGRCSGDALRRLAYEEG